MLTDCPTLLEQPGGTRRVDVPVGMAFRRNESMKHSVFNAEELMDFVEVEVKRQEKPFTSTTLI